MGYFPSLLLSRHRFHPASPLIYYSFVFFFLALGDAIMSYLAPVYIENWIKNTFLMGLIIASSSLAGFVCDFLFSKIFPGRHYAFFFWLALLAAFLFPVTFISLPPVVTVFVIGMITWGVYYELLQFSHFNFINRFIPKANFHNAWGTLSSFKALAYILGPIISGLIIIYGFHRAFTLPLVFYSFAAVGFLVLLIFLKFRSTPVNLPEDQTFYAKAKIWSGLFRKVWMVYLFLFLISVIDSAFWTVGILISEELRHTSVIGSLLLPAYTLPALFTGLALSRLPATGKKRIALLSGGLAGLILAAVGLTGHPLALIIVVFVSSIFLSVSFPEIEAVFEDYVSRLGGLGTDMVGLESSAVSASYIIGPVIAGGLAQVFGNRQMFTILGLILAVYSIIIFFIIPKKIRIPSSEILNF